jgi:hypothetical protein
MPNTNASFSPRMRSDELKAQSTSRAGSAQDGGGSETEALLGRLYGESHRYVEGTKYAALAETEALVNLPESAQEPMTKDLPKTAVQQRRQVLLSILTEMKDMESKEATMLTDEAHEDPPSI